MRTVYLPILLISILLTSIVLISFSNINKLVISIEYSEEDDNSTQKRSNSNSQNIIEEEEQSINELYHLFPYSRNIKTIKLFYLTKQLSSVYLDIVTQPPL